MRRRFSEEERETMRDMREAGVPVKRIANTTYYMVKQKVLVPWRTVRYESS